VTAIEVQVNQHVESSRDRWWSYLSAYLDHLQIAGRGGCTGR
jgi:hypothetical protein